MLEFIINSDSCTRCGECVADCPARIITMDEGVPTIAADKEASCYRCQHCLMICPTGAVSILGLKPSGSRPLAGGYPDPDKLEILIKGRRSVRRYKQENLEPDLLQRLLDVAWHAPTGMNSRDVLFTLVDDRGKLSRLRDEVMAGLGRLVREERLPEGKEFFADFVRVWEEKGIDILFRGAPHLLIASAPRQGACPVPDCLIALSYFELFAQSLGVGTVWNGLCKWAICDLLPETRQRLGIPEEHVIGYVMSFGRPALRFQRTVQHGPAAVNRVAI
ncbi:MAG: nitroreductase family protein [Geobacteraceae bacterium]|nr:nitroreductase family protein [Geobacteraceae bacterium]